MRVRACVRVCVLSVCYLYAEAAHRLVAGARVEAGQRALGQRCHQQAVDGAAVALKHPLALFGLHTAPGRNTGPPFASVDVLLGPFQFNLLSSVCFPVRVDWLP